MLGVLCIIGCPVQLIREVFLRLHFCRRHTFASIEAHAYVLPHFDALTHLVILVSSAFIFQRFAEVRYSVFVKRSSFKRLLNLRKAYIDLCLLNCPKRSSFWSLLLNFTLD